MDPSRASGMVPACPACGERPALVPLEEHADCPSCKAALVVWRQQRVLAGGVESRLDREAAQEVLRRTLMDERAMPRLQLKATEAACRQLFVPFWELSGIQAGQVTALGDSGPRDTIYRWAEAHCPAIKDRDGLGVDEIDVVRLRSREALDGRRFLTEQELAQRGTVLPTDRALEEVLPRLDTEARRSGASAQVPLTDCRYALLYYPLWLFVVSCGPQSYQVTVDGLTGAVAAGRLPARERPRATTLTLTAGGAALLLGALWGPAGLAGRTWSAGTLWGLAALGLAVVGAVLWLALGERTDLVFVNSVPSRQGTGRMGSWLARFRQAGVRGLGRVIFKQRELGR